MYKLCTINLEECEVLHVEINQRVDGRSASPHGVQQKMCRDFLSIFSPYGALVAPQRDLKEIMIVAQTEFVTAIDFRSWLHKECLKVKHSNRADSLSVEECIRYSLVVWLEPHHYYRCGKALLKGPFLGANNPRSISVVFAVYCTSSGEIYLRVTFEVVRLFPLESWQVSDPSVEPRWVFCLPKLGRGQLVGKQSCLPPDCGFANYGEMRAYWKNCYGYDLPLREPGSYYDIWFNGINSSFLYPDFCVMSSKPMPIQFRDEYNMTSRASDEFLYALASGKHMICGVEVHPVVVDPKFISLSVHPIACDSRRRKISSKPVQSRFREKESFLKSLFSSVDNLDSTEEKFEEHSRLDSRTIVPAVTSRQLPESTPLLSPATPNFAMIPRTPKTPQKLVSLKPQVNIEAVRGRKRRIDVE